jgi:hypothetical protein
MADATVVKPGWKTSEFWLHALAGLGLAVLGLAEQLLPQAGANPIVQGVGAVVIPLVLGWLAKAYGDGRVAVKSAASMISSASEAGKTADTGEALNK